MGARRGIMSWRSLWQRSLASAPSLQPPRWAIAGTSAARCCKSSSLHPSHLCAWPAGSASQGTPGCPARSVGSARRLSFSSFSVRQGRVRWRDRVSGLGCRARQQGTATRESGGGSGYHSHQPGCARQAKQHTQWPEPRAEAASNGSSRCYIGSGGACWRTRQGGQVRLRLAGLGRQAGARRRPHQGCLRVGER